jgi:transcriptional regulator GlxA family with amidase domain
MIDLAGPLSAFKLADEIGASGHYEAVVLSRTGGSIPSREGVDVMSLPEPGGPVDTLVVIGGPGVFTLEEPDFDAVRTLARGARRVTSVCTGAFVLAGSTYGTDLSGLRPALPRG